MTEEVLIKPRFPEVIDNTMRSDFLTCPRKFAFSFIENLAPAAPSIHLHAGGAFAKGLEVARRSFYEQGNDESIARRDGLQALMAAYGPIEAPITRSGDKSLENVIRAFDSYMERYKLGLDPIRPFVTANGKAMVEFSFTIPLEIEHPETGNPLLYGGRADMIGIMSDALWVTDEKTASQLGETWADQWKLDSQFTGYIAAAHMHGYPVAGALIRGVGLLKTKITHAEVQLHRGTWMIERWWQQLHRDVKRMVQAWKEGYFDYAIKKDSCAGYGGCSFLMLCERPESEHENYLPIYFRSRNWNPLAKDSGEDLLKQAEAKGQQTQPDDLNIPGL